MLSIFKCIYNASKTDNKRYPRSSVVEPKEVEEEIQEKVALRLHRHVEQKHCTQEVLNNVHVE